MKDSFITPGHVRAFQAITSRLYDNITLWSCRINGEPGVAIAMVDHAGEGTIGSCPWICWGRRMCEGYSHEIGATLCGSVVKRETKGLPTTWMAPVNATALGEYPERSEANLFDVLHCG
jgi:hypothetical protein